MAGRRERRPVAPVLASVSVVPGQTAEQRGDAVERVTAALGQAVDSLARGSFAGASEGSDVTLATGTNKLGHGLGRTPRAVLVIPKTASAGFAYGYDPAQPDNPTPNRVAWVVVVGGPMVARVFFL